MAAGLPFVTTPTGAEGLGLGDLEDVLVAEDRPTNWPGSRSTSTANGAVAPRPGRVLEPSRSASGGTSSVGPDRGLRAGRRRAAARTRYSRGLRMKNAKSLGRTRSTIERLLKQRHQIDERDVLGVVLLEVRSDVRQQNWSSVPPKSAR